MLLWVLWWAIVPSFTHLGEVEQVVVVLICACPRYYVRVYTTAPTPPARSLPDLRYYNCSR